TRDDGIQVLEALRYRELPWFHYDIVHCVISNSFTGKTEKFAASSFRMTSTSRGVSRAGRILLCSERSSASRIILKTNCRCFGRVDEATPSTSGCHSAFALKKA